MITTPQRESPTAPADGPAGGSAARTAGHASGPVRLTLTLADLPATEALGARLARMWRVGDVIALEGPLAAGKTSLARAALRAAADAAIEVPSPTFTLVQTYDLPGAPVWHFDLYRLGEPDEAIELGWQEARAEAVVLVEWPDRLGPLLPEDRLTIALAPGARDRDEERIATLIAGPTWRDRLTRLAGPNAGVAAPDGDSEPEGRQ